MTVPNVSVVICTCDRADSLRLTLESLCHLSYPAVEVVVVESPSSDQTQAVLADFDGKIKRVHADERNLSVSRNLGMAAAAGEIVAFIDDDGAADGMWLDDLAGVFADPEVAGTGGPVVDHTGHTLQARYNIADRWGDARIELDAKRLEVLDHPDTWQFPYPMGTNALFRRESLVALGGFDENFAFYLDETDVCLRLIDAGYRIAPQEQGLVYHKFLPSAVRNAERVTVDRFNVALSRAYFSMRHGLPKSDVVEMFSAFSKFVELQRADLLGHVNAGRVEAEAYWQFNRDAVAAWKEAEERAARPPRTRPPDWFDARQTDFLPFPTCRPPGRVLRLCVVTVDYPPGSIPGIGRACHTLATGLAAAGHLVHVITASRSEHSTVDLEEGVWVHRIVSAPHEPPPIADLPQVRWDRAASVLDEVSRLGALVPIDVAHLPNWDAEGLAVTLDGRYRTCLYAYTPVLAVAECDARIDPHDPAIAALAEAERVGYERADLVMVSFPQMLEQLSRLYGVRVPSPRAAIVPLALPDVASPVHQAHADVVEVLFIGRLEPRKGIDTLLAVVPDLCARHPTVRFTIIGDDAIVAEDGLTYRQSFEAEALPEVLERVSFTGPLPGEDVLSALARCDVFVAPSRFESFGLMNLEAMRASKPVVSTAVNGITSVVRDGTDGILVPPDDPDALAAALRTLIEDPRARAEMGANGREAFETRFSVERMVQRTVASLEALLDGKPQPNQPETTGAGDPGELDPLTKAVAERQQRLLGALRCPRCRAPVEVQSEVTTRDGRVKTGTILCPACDQTLAAIRSFQVVFAEVEALPAPLADTPADIAGTGPEVGVLGEQRITPADDLLQIEGWDTYPDCWVGRERGATISLRAACTDVRLRLVKHPRGGIVDVTIDGARATTIDTRTGPGSVDQIVDVATDLELASHEIVLTVRDVGPDRQVLFHEFVLFGPVDDGLPFAAPAPFARGNLHSERIMRHVRASEPSQLLLECGGGDRRTDRPNYINLEFLPYEGADLRADIHRLPFADDTFDVVVNQAVLEHVSDPAAATSEMVRVCKPGGMILSEVAFMQPLHGVPFHFFNMTPWGLEHLFESTCTIEESDWFGELSFTMNWLLEVAGVTGKLSPADREEWRQRFATLDELIDHESLKMVASGVWVAARKRRH